MNNYILILYKSKISPVDNYFGTKVESILEAIDLIKKEFESLEVEILPSETITNQYGHTHHYKVGFTKEDGIFITMANYYIVEYIL